MSSVLTDTQVFQYEILEGTGQDKGRLVARGEFARADIPTANKRMYPGQIWEREIKRLTEKVSERACYGLLDHPKDGKTTLSDASHLITDMSFDGNRVVGTMEVLDTPKGNTLKAILEGGGKVGVSSRGIGTTKKGNDGQDIVQDDYQLMTFDFVADPANATSWPKFRTEDKEEEMEGTPMAVMTTDVLRQEYPELVKEIEDNAKASAPVEDKAVENAKDQLRDEFKRKFIDTISDQETEVEERVRGELMGDPELGAARVAIEGIVKQLRPWMLDENTAVAVKDREEKISELEKTLAEKETELAELKGTCEDILSQTEAIGYRCFAEQKLAKLEDDDQRQQVINMLGDFTRFKNKEEFHESFVDCLTRMSEDEKRQEEDATQVSDMEAKMAKLEEQRDKAVELGTILAAKAYAERKISEHPHRAKLRKVFEDSDCKSTEEVDSIVENWNETNPVSEDFDNLSSKLGGGMSHVPNKKHIVEDHGSNGQSVLGVPMAELAKLAQLTEGKEDNGNPY